MIGELLVDIIKVSTVTIIVSKATKAIGQKDIAEIISGVGLLAVGIDVLLIVSPVGKWVLDTTKVIGDTLTLLNQWGITISKILHMGG